ncbi:MAG TPA: energy transducer TonB [Thermoanaerobaculia bacterium]|nr:energy transducer TonB [Thermoanaerobaculia bacterium]
MKSLFAVLLLSAATAFAADPLMVRVTTYERLPQVDSEGNAPEAQLPATLLAPPQGGWPASYDAVRQILGARRGGRFNVMVQSILSPKPLTTAESAAFFVTDLGRPVEVKADGDVLLPDGKHTTIEVKPNTTTIFGASDEMYYIAVSVLPAAETRDDVMVLSHGEKPLDIVSRVEPKFPIVEAMRNHSGLVLTQLRIEPDGSVGAVTVLQKVQPQIDAAAIEALKQWHFKPPMRDGKPVVAYMMMATAFRIQ